MIYFAPLLLPSRVLVARDILFLHLPLRANFRALLSFGLPVWDPFIHGGQPILSNPHYGAFYPATWLFMPLPAHAAISGMILFHFVLAFAGAWLLARALGCGRAAAALAAVAFAGSGWFVALTSTLLVFTGMAWLPWVLRWGDAALRRGPQASPSARWRASLWPAGAWAMQILNGDPAAVVTSGFFLLALAISAGRRERRLGRALKQWTAIAALALALAAAQAVPTAARMLESARGAGLSVAQATAWSTHPARLVEAVFPHFYGDPARDEENLYFGWNLNDKQYPFLLSIYPGLLIALLGFGALLRERAPRRWVWTAAIGAGVALGLGRFSPVFLVAHRILPLLGGLRYPEKFLLLPLAALPFAAALGWERLLAVRRTADSRTPSWPLAGAGVLFVLAALLALRLFAAPEAATQWVRSHSGLEPAPATVALGLAYLRREALVSAGVAAGAVALFLLYRRRTVSERALAICAVTLVAADLWMFGHRFNPTLPIAEIDRIAQPARALLGSAAAEQRIFTDVAFYAGPPIGLRIGVPGTYQLRSKLQTLEPAAGNLWGFSYALHEDFDLLLTDWGRFALATLHTQWPHPDAAQRYLGAWNVAALLHVRSPQEMIAGGFNPSHPPLPAGVETNPHVLPRWRLPESVSFHPDPRAALAAAEAEGFDLGHREHAVGAPPEGTERGSGAVVQVEEKGGRISVRYRAPGPAFLVGAMTYDNAWEAAVDGQGVATWPTAAGQMGIAVPAGEHRVELSYFDPRVGLGVGLSLITILACALRTSRLRNG